MSDIIFKLRSELQNKQRDIAVCAMERPQSDPAAHAVMAGKYQGIQIALDVLEDLLRDQLEKEKA